MDSPVTAPGIVIPPIPGAEHNAKIIELARWAVKEYNEETKATLKFKNVLSATEMGVPGKPGITYYITLEAFDGPCDIKVYEAEVLVVKEPGMEFEKLVKFKQLQPNA